MKSIAVTILVVLVVIVLVMALISFQVRETESALVTTFGKATRQITEPGLYFRWPPPIQQIYKFDSRLRIFEADLAETPTKGAVPIIVNTYVVWRIADPNRFLNSVGSTSAAEAKLHSQMNETQSNVVGQYSFSEFVNSDTNNIKIQEIQDKMLANLHGSVREAYGIEVKALGIKQLKISADVSKDVFDRMRGERNRKTENTIAEGRAEAVAIRTQADAQKTELLAAAQARAKAIMGQGDAEAAKYYEMLQADPELAMFLRDVEVLPAILKERSTYIINTDKDPFKLLREMPNLQPKK
jgi:membrane protease subunit HflC